MGEALRLEVELSSIDCGNCGGTYAINERYRRHKQEKGGYWQCPYCAASWGFGKSSLDKAREELEAERQAKARALSEANTLRVERDALERKLARVNRGTCPHCRRTFQNLARHMRCKHADMGKASA